MVSVIERAPSVRKPAHDEPVAADHLLAVDAEVLARLRRAAGNGKTPGNKRPGVLGPAGLHRQAAEIDVLLFDDDLLAWCGGNCLGRHVEELLPNRKLLPQITQSPWRLGLAQKRQHFPDVS